MRFPIFSSDGTNLYTNAEYSSLQERKDGFQPNHAANSKLVNSFMKTASVLLDALAQYSSTSGDVGPETTSITLGKIIDVDSAQDINGVKTFFVLPQADSQNTNTPFPNNDVDFMTYAATKAYAVQHFPVQSSSATLTDIINDINTAKIGSNTRWFVVSYNYLNGTTSTLCYYYTASDTHNHFCFTEDGVRIYGIDTTIYGSQTVYDTLINKSNCFIVNYAAETKPGLVSVAAQTFGGKKTFSSVPSTTGGDPSADDDLARKKYVDKLRVYKHSLKTTVTSTDIVLIILSTDATAYSSGDFTQTMLDKVISGSVGGFPIDLTTPLVVGTGVFSISYMSDVGLASTAPSMTLSFWTDTVTEL